MAVADVNGDGLEDVFIGGGAGQNSQLYFQQKDGSFRSETFDDKDAEKVKALFLDVNNDGKMDLYVAHGSNEFEENSPLLQDRLYINQGEKLVYDPNALPNLPITTGAICAADIDNDGDLDIFVGGMMQQQRYPYPSKSYFLRNDSRRDAKHCVFTDITPPSVLSSIGMVRTAIFTDYDKDGDKDLMITGEWMNVEIFNNNKRNFTKATVKGLDATREMKI